VGAKESPSSPATRCNCARTSCGPGTGPWHWIWRRTAVFSRLGIPRWLCRCACAFRSYAEGFRQRRLDASPSYEHGQSNKHRESGWDDKARTRREPTDFPLLGRGRQTPRLCEWSWLTGNPAWSLTAVSHLWNASTVRITHALSALRHSRNPDRRQRTCGGWNLALQKFAVGWVKAVPSRYELDTGGQFRLDHQHHRQRAARVNMTRRMNGTATIGNKGTAAPLPRLYLRPDEAARAIGVSRRTLSAWQSARVISFRRVGRTVLFSVADIQTAIDRFRIAAVGELSPCRQQVGPRAVTAPTQSIASGLPIRKRRMQRSAPEPAIK
jgi:excisionase family DNA binding protein